MWKRWYCKHIGGGRKRSSSSWNHLEDGGRGGGIGFAKTVPNFYVEVPVHSICNRADNHYTLSDDASSHYYQSINYEQIGPKNLKSSSSVSISQENLYCEIDPTYY